MLLLTHRQNLYLISINVTNKLKEKFYHEYVPEILDVRIESSYPYIVQLATVLTLCVRVYKASTKPESQR
jgi:hypothetical protein